MQALNTTNANYDAALRVKTSVEKMTSRLLAVDNKPGYDSNPTDQVVESNRWHGVSFDGGPKAEFAVRGSASQGEGDNSSASVVALFGMDTTTYSHGPKQDAAGKVVAGLHEYKIDSPAGTQTAVLNISTGTLTFTDDPVRMALW